MQKSNDLIKYQKNLLSGSKEYQKIKKILTPSKIKSIRKILISKLSYEEKVARFKKYLKLLKEAEKHFTKLTELLNQESKYKGYKNFIEQISQKTGIPKNITKNFIEEAKELIILFNQKVKFKNKEKTYWSEHYLQYPTHKEKVTYKIPGDIYKFWGKTDPKAKNIISKTKIIKLDEEEEASCSYKKEKSICEIRCFTGKQTIPATFTFLHKVDHAKQPFISAAKRILLKSKNGRRLFLTTVNNLLLIKRTIHSP